MQRTDEGGVVMLVQQQFSPLLVSTLNTVYEHKNTHNRPPELDGLFYLFLNEYAETLINIQFGQTSREVDDLQRWLAWNGIELPNADQFKQILHYQQMTYSTARGAVPLSAVTAVW